MVKRTFFAALACVFFAQTPSAQTNDACSAPDPVCAAREIVFIVSAFEPFASAVRIAPDLLVTNRHVVADHDTVQITLPGGSVVVGSVLPTAYDGDLALVHSPDLGDGAFAELFVEADLGVDFFTVAGDDARRRVRAYEPGQLLVPLADGAPRPRIHHSAYSQPGNSGGALVDGQGRLVGIVASGGAGRYEAVPASDIALLREASGEAFVDDAAAMGQATRQCVEGMEQWLPGPAADERAFSLVESCLGTSNRQLYDLAAQTLGRSRRFDVAVILLNTAIDRDPHALNSRVSLVITLMFLQRFIDTVPHLEFLLTHLPDDEELLRIAIQAGVRGGETDLTDTALLLIEQHHPGLLAWARRLVDAGSPTPPQ
jgi:hypothetical protein